MNDQTVDLNTWGRGKLFRFYMERMRIVMSLTVEMDVTALVRFTKNRRLKFYPVMIWAVSKVVNAHDEFKYGWDAGGNLIRWACVSPSYAHFHPEDEAFTKLVTPYSEDLEGSTRDFSGTGRSTGTSGPWRKTSRPTTSTYPAFRGSAIPILTSMCLTRGNFSPR